MNDGFTIASPTRPYGPPMASERELISHLLRRATFGPHPGRVEELLGTRTDDLVDDLLGGAEVEISDDEARDRSFDDEEWDAIVQWWLGRLVDPAAGLHERMTWYWHTHFTSSLDKVPARAMWRQHALVRRHALGNFRDLCHEMTTDAAMLVYLDGSYSTGDAPNENFARELMELFTLGAGAYAEDDIRVAARGFSGWVVDGETADVGFEPENHYDRPLTFLGTRRRWSAEALVDRILDHPACAGHVAGRIHRHLVGTSPTPARREELASSFRRSDYEIRPLVEDILRHPTFWAAVRARPRQPVEWLVAALAALDLVDQPIDTWWLELLGQLPFGPPNVAGWPDDERWLAASQMLLRTTRIIELELPDSLYDRVPAEVDAVLARCGIYDPTPATLAALDRAASAQPEYENGLELLLTLALTSPEFSLA